MPNTVLHPTVAIRQAIERAIADKIEAGQFEIVPTQEVPRG